jgi:nucleoside-diphosphate-sugar epimerase
MKVFVTGATGYLGRPIAQAFRRAGHDVSGLARDPARARALAADEILPVLGTLQDPGGFTPAAADCDILVHAAADAGPAAFELDRRAVEALLAMARHGRKARALLYTSGTWVYGDTGGRAVDESAPVHPPRYASLRPETERLVLGSRNVRGVVLRPGCVYGRQGSLTSMWFQSAAQGVLEIVGDGSARWPLVHQDDLADAYLRAAESDVAGEIFNLAETEAQRVRDMASAAARASGYGGQVRSLSVTEALERFGPFAECLAYDQQLDSRKAAERLGWRPRHAGFVAGARTYYESWRASLPS